MNLLTLSGKNKILIIFRTLILIFKINIYISIINNTPINRIHQYINKSALC
jgi:hypothetical protein